MGFGGSQEAGCLVPVGLGLMWVLHSGLFKTQTELESVGVCPKGTEQVWLPEQAGKAGFQLFTAKDSV